MITIDGSLGEGGGQVLRTALSLSMITGDPVRLINIRAGRKKPGLMRQHRTAVQAAARISGARVQGDHAGSTELEFKPASIRHGEYAFAVGTAGSATLVVQTVLPALLSVAGDSRITVEGGTHNPFAPPYDFLEQTFLPFLRRMGANVACRLLRYGFFPAGGGKLCVDACCNGTLNPVSVTERGASLIVSATCLSSGLDNSIARREANALIRRLNLPEDRVVVGEVESNGPGNAVMVDVSTEDGEHLELREVFTAFGERGVSAEKVAATAAGEAKDYLARPGAAVGRYLADQLLLPLALAGGGEFTTTAPSRHTQTNIEVIHAFLPGRFTVRKVGDGVHAIAYGK